MYPESCGARRGVAWRAGRLAAPQGPAAPPRATPPRPSTHTALLRLWRAFSSPRGTGLNEDQEALLNAAVLYSVGTALGHRQATGTTTSGAYTSLLRRARLERGGREGETSHIARQRVNRVQSTEQMNFLFVRRRDAHRPTSDGAGENKDYDDISRGRRARAPCASPFRTCSSDGKDVMPNIESETCRGADEKRSFLICSVFLQL